MMMIGIDPGAHGAIAVVNEAREVLAVTDMPVTQVQKGKRMISRVNPQLLAATVRGLMMTHPGQYRACVEQVGAMPGQGVSSTFEFGRGYGAVLGVLGALQVPALNVTPLAWKRTFALGRSKDASRNRVMELYPGLADQLDRVKDDGRAEAVLIALWGLLRGANA